MLDISDDDDEDNDDNRNRTKPIAGWKVRSKSKLLKFPSNSSRFDCTRVS